MPTTKTSIAADVLGGIFLILSHGGIVLHLKSSRILDTKISIKAAAIVLVGALLSRVHLFQTGDPIFEGCVSALSQSLGLGPNSSFATPVEDGRTVATYLARFAQAVSTSPDLFDFFVMVAVASCSFYILHNALIKKIGNSAASDAPVPAQRGKKDKKKANTPPSSPAPPPPVTVADHLVKAFCLALSALAYRAASGNQIVLAKMLGRNLLVYGQYEQVKLLSSASPLILVLCGGFLAVSSASILTSLQTELTGYSPTNIGTFFSKCSQIEIHFYGATLVTCLVATVFTTKSLYSRKSSSSLPVLALLYTALVFFGPSGFGWINRMWRIDTKIFVVYTYLGFSISLILTLFFCGAPGLIVMFGLTNGLATLQSVELAKYLALSPANL